MNVAEKNDSLHPLVAAVLAQKTVRSSRFYEEPRWNQWNQTSDNEENRGEQRRADDVEEATTRSFDGLQTNGDEEHSSTSSTESKPATTTEISVMQCLKEAYGAYKYVNQVRSNGTQIGMVGSAGLLALKAISAIYGAIFHEPGSGQATLLTATQSIDCWYWLALGAAIGVAVHSEVRWLLSDHSIAQRHLVESQRFAHMIANSGPGSVGEQESAESHKHRRRKRRREQE